jgi:hypothetical protein
MTRLRRPDLTLEDIERSCTMDQDRPAPAIRIKETRCLIYAARCSFTIGRCLRPAK